jgi:hypothetical protein
MNTFWLDSQKDRDDGVHMLLFAAREAFHESLRCSPFELVLDTLWEEYILNHSVWIQLQMANNM